MGRSLKLAAIFAYAALQLIAKRPSTRQQRAEWLHQFCVRAIRWMGIAVRRQGPFPERGVVIANHLGYLDVIAFAALHRCVFIGKSEIRRWPLLGWMSTMAGTLYVHRGRGGSAERARKGMRAASDAGIPLVFFPEGTMQPRRHGAALPQRSAGPGDGGRPADHGGVHPLSPHRGQRPAISRWQMSASGTTRCSPGTSSACSRCAESRWSCASPSRPSHSHPPPPTAASPPKKRAPPSCNSAPRLRLRRSSLSNLLVWRTILQCQSNGRASVHACLNVNRTEGHGISRAEDCTFFIVLVSSIAKRSRKQEVADLSI